MFFHELGEDFVLSLELLLQQGDPAVLVSVTKVIDVKSRVPEQHL
jgi:hypothetical protein